MSGTIRYKDGAWRIAYQADRKRHYRTVRAPNNRTGRAEASRALAALVTEVDQGQHRGDRLTTVGQLLDAWLDHHGPNLEAGTLSAYRSDARLHLGPLLGAMPLHKLRGQHLDQIYTRFRLEGLTPKTIRNIAGTLHAALQQAVRWDWIPRNPADSATPPVAKKRNTVIPTVRQVDAAINAARPDFAAMIRLAATTGHRRGSLLALRWTDLDLDKGDITFARAIAAVNGQLIEKGTKADRVDRSTIGAATLDVLRQHRTRCAESALSCGVPLPADAFLWAQRPDGAQCWHPGGIGSRWRRTCQRAEVTGVRFHDLKHFAATHMLAAGIPVHVVAQRTGTSAQTIQRIYAHHLPRADAEAADLMDGLLG